MPFINQTYKQIAKKGIVAANTEETLYTVPASSAVVGQIVAANTTPGSNLTFSLAIVSGGGSATPSDWIAYDVTLTPGEIWTFTGVTLNAADQVKVRSNQVSNVTVATGIIFHIYGELQN
jgi:hypothetical protein